MRLQLFLEVSSIFYIENSERLTTQYWVSPGNLSSHLSKLENAGYIDVTKEFIGKKPPPP